MGLRLLEEEERSLEAALALLDNCGDDQQQNLSAPFDVAFDLDALLDADDMVLDSPTSDHESIDGITHNTNASSDGGDRQVVARVKPTRQRATKKHKPAGPAAPRRRTRTEILELREQVIQLTIRIDQLNKRSQVQPQNGPGFHSNHITHGTRLPLIDAQGSSLELGGVILEREKLREAELLNAKLKVAWRRQLKLCQQLENVFKRKLTPADVDVLLGTKSQSPIHDNAMVRDNSLAFAKLHHYLETLYAQAAAISAFISKRGTTRVSSSSQVHHNSLLGDIFEFTTSTPLTCELHELETQVWGVVNNEANAKKKGNKPHVVSHVSHYIVHYYTVLVFITDSNMMTAMNCQQDTRKGTTATHEHQFTHKFDCQFGAIYVNGVSAIRKFVEQHRVVITYTSTLSLAGTELTFREIGWLILLQTAPEQKASVPTAMPPSSLLQTCYRMYPDHTSGSTAASRSTLDSSYFENFILQSHCETMRAHQLHLQSDLFGQFGSSSPGAALTGARSDPFNGCYTSSDTNRQ